MNDLSDAEKKLLGTSAEAFFEDIGLKNLSEAKKEQMLNKMIETVMDKILLRIEPMLTEEDNRVLKTLEQRQGEEADNEIMMYIVSAVPGIDKIAAEEVAIYKAEIKAQIARIMETFDKNSS